MMIRKSFSKILPAIIVVGATLATLTACTTNNMIGGTSELSLAPIPASDLNGNAVPVVAHSDHSVLLHSDDPKLASNKRLVYDLWRTIIDAGQIEQADNYLSKDYIQHNHAIPTGRAAFKAHFADLPRLDEVPDKIQGPLVTIVAEGNYVAMAFVSDYPEPDGSGNTYTSTHFDLFKIEKGLIVEHWDSVQLKKGQFAPAPEDGGPLPIVGVHGHAQLAMLDNDNIELANNKRLVFDTWRHIPEAGREEIAELYLDPIYIQHNPNATTGRDGFVEYFGKRPDSSIDTYLEDPIVAILAEDNLVIQVLQEERPNPNTGETYYVAWFDMFRVENGRLFEHWDTASKGELPASMQAEE